MGLETALYISDLNETNPANGDPIGQGDDHIRLLKLVLKTCFPLLNGALNAGRVPFTPTGGIGATTVQAALAELDTEKSATTHNHDTAYQAKSANLDLFALATPTPELVSALDAASLADFRTAIGLALGVNVAAFAPTATEAELTAGTEAALRAISPALLRFAVLAAATGAGSGLDADKLDGLHANEISFVTQIASGSVGAVSTLDVDIDASLYSRITIVLDNVIPSSDGANLKLRPIYSGGVISDAMKSHIFGTAGYVTDGTPTYPYVIVGYDGSPTPTTTGVGSAAGEGASCCIDISGYGSTLEGGLLIESSCGFTTSSGAASGAKIITPHKWSDAPRVLTGVRLSWSAGSFEAAGTYKVYGLRRG